MIDGTRLLQTPSAVKPKVFCACPYDGNLLWRWLWEGQRLFEAHTALPAGLYGDDWKVDDAPAAEPPTFWSWSISNTNPR